MARLAGVIAIYVALLAAGFDSGPWNEYRVTVPAWVPGCGCQGVDTGDLAAVALATVGVILLWRAPPGR